MAKFIVVTSAGKDTYWYADKIGEVFEVTGEKGGEGYFVRCGRFVDEHVVDYEDCKEVEGILDLIANLARRVSELERAVKRLGIEKAAEEINKAIVKKRQLTRDEIVRRAIEDVAELERLFLPSYKYVDFVLNRDKRTVVALIRGKNPGGVFDRGIAKCAPGDVFNAHIGKAIALRRALGLEVPAEYLNAPQPKEPRVGDIVKWTDTSDESTSEIHRVNRIDDEEYWLDDGWDYLSSLTVLDDTESTTEAAANDHIL